MKRVDPSVYTKKYYLTDCVGFVEFKNRKVILSTTHQEILKYFTIRQGMKILDIGCGRGEMILYVARLGAIGFGIDYSSSAIKLANSLKNVQSKKIKGRMNFYKMDAKKINFKDSTFDVVILSGVLEHLYDEELHTVFKEVKRVLKKEASIIIYTAPNKLFIDFAYKYYCYFSSSIFVWLWNKITNRIYPNIAKPNELRTESHRIMHVNEPTYLYLYSLFKKHNLRGSIKSTNISAKKEILSIKDTMFNFLVFFHPLSKFFPLNIVFGSDFLSILKNEK